MLAIVFSFLKVDPSQEKVLSIVLGLLVFFTTLFGVWRWVRPRPFLDEMLRRTASWWLILVAYVVFFCIEPAFAFVGMGVLSAAALRELYRNLPESQLPSSLRWLSFAIVPLQFYFAARGQLLTVATLIPAGFFLLATVYVLALEETRAAVGAVATAVWALLLCVYGLGHLALLLAVPPPLGTTASGLFLFFIFLTQFNDVLQFLWGSIFGRHKIAPLISPNKTWEGLIGATLTTSAIAVALRDLTPFTLLQSALVGGLLSFMGFVGDLNVSAFKRTVGIKDLGTALPGHGGILDRIDSITLASLLYFYLLLYWHSSEFPWSQVIN